MKQSLEDRFFAKVLKSMDSDGCWNWIASKYRDGYGRIQFQRKSVRAHRISWQIHHGPIPDGVQVLHRCDNPLCVRPDHLFLGTHDDNMADKVAKGRQFRPEGEANGAARLSCDEVINIRKLYVGGGRTYQSLAAQFGVSSGDIRLIVTMENWNGLESPDGYLAEVAKAKKLSRAKGERMPNSKLTPADIIEIRRLRKLGHENKEIGSRFGVSDVLISLIARRKAWAHIPDHTDEALK